MTDSLFADTVAVPDTRLSLVGAERTPIIEKLFSLFIWDMENRTVMEHPNIDPAAARGVSGRSTKAEYYFRVPPKTHEMDEPFATHITPTQGRGVYVESHGSILKEVRLSGTTGLRPHKKTAASVIPVLNITEEQLRSVWSMDPHARKIPDDEATGIDDIIFLRNLFRLYSDLKNNSEMSRTCVMVWRNARTDDYWIVEPRDFKLVQNAQSPLTYQYQISLTALVRFSAAIDIEEDLQDVSKDRKRLLTRVQSYTQNLLGIYLRVSSAITRVQGAGYFGLSTILSPLLTTIRGLNAVKSSVEQFYHGLTASTRDLTAAIVSGLIDLVDFLPPHDPVIRDLRRALIWCSKIATEQAFQDSGTSTADSRRERNQRAFVGEAASEVRPNSTNQYTTFLGRFPRSNNVGSDYVNDYEDIRAVARRLCGDVRRWPELVVLNDLRPPYISVEGGPGVLRPGDQILYPRRGRATSGNLTTEINPSLDSQENTVTTPTSELIRAYGRDLGLRSVDGGLELADVAINNRGDLATIVGIPNVEQAVRIKFAVEQGELPAHRSFGALYPIGSKATIDSFNEYRINALATLQSDPRIESVEKLQFDIVGDTLTVSAKLALSKTRDYLSTNFALRSI